MAQISGQQSDSPPDVASSAALRTTLTVGILIYLAVVLLGPLSNPVGAEHLTVPLARQVRPVHEALFLGHGYRFFAPDPGPSHILEYRVRLADSERVLRAHFPNRDEHWPRQLYHRWFMLSETLYSQCSTLPSPADHRQLLFSLSQEIELYRERGELATMHQLIKNRDLQKQDYQISTNRRDQLLRSIARHLLAVHSGASIELYLLERLIPRPFDVASGVRLTDPRFLSEPRFLGRFDLEDFDAEGESP